MNNFYLLNFLQRFPVAIAASLYLTGRFLYTLLGPTGSSLVTQLCLRVPNPNEARAVFCGLCTAAFVGLLTECRRVDSSHLKCRGQNPSASRDERLPNPNISHGSPIEWRTSVLYSLLAAIAVGAGVYLLNGLNVVTFVCLLSFVLMFTVPIWLQGTRDSFFSFCVHMQKRMLQAIIITSAVTIVTLQVVIVFDFSSGLAHGAWLVDAVFIVMVFFFSPMFTLYAVSKENLWKESVIKGSNSTLTIENTPSEKTLIYFTEFLAIGLAVVYLKEFSDIVRAIVNPEFVYWGSHPVVMILFVLSTIVHLVANSPVVVNDHPYLIALRFFRKCFPATWLVLAVFDLIRMIGLETVSCINIRCGAVWLGWAVIMSLWLARKQWRRNALAKTVLIVTNAGVGTLLYFDREIEQVEQRVMTFLESEKFFVNGVYQGKRYTPGPVGFQLCLCLDWLMDHQDVMVSRLGELVTNADGKKYFVMKTLKGKVQVDMSSYRVKLMAMFENLEHKNTPPLTTHTLKIPLRLPFCAVVTPYSMFEFFRSR
jgi:hypothetical protein